MCAYVDLVELIEPIQSFLCSDAHELDSGGSSLESSSTYMFVFDICSRSSISNLLLSHVIQEGSGELLQMVSSEGAATGEWLHVPGQVILGESVFLVLVIPSVLLAEGLGLYSLSARSLKSLQSRIWWALHPPPESGYAMPVVT